MAEKREGIEQILQTCLELIRSGQETVDSALARYPDHADELSSLLETATWLQERRDALAPRPEFIAASRQRLLARIEQEKAASTPKSLRTVGASVWNTILSLFAQKRFAYQFVVATILLVFLISTTSGVAAAAQHSIPGDTLYGVKMSLEQIQLALSFSEARRAQYYVTFAERRLVEVQSLVIEGRYEYLHNTVDQFYSQANEASRLLRSLGTTNTLLARELANKLRNVVEGQISLMPVLSQAAPPDSRSEIERLMQMAELVKSEAQNIEALMGGTPLPTITPTLITITPVPPTPVPTKTPVPTTAPVVTVAPLSTPLSAKTEAAPTSTVRPSRTPVPTLQNSGKKPTPTPTKASPAKPTRKPTKEKKEPPGLENRPPKPTKKS